MSLYLVKFTFTKPELGQYEPLVRIVTFTLLQLLQHNIQLGAASQFSILSSHWFIYGCRQHFIVINLSQTVVNYRQLLNAVRAVASSRRHLLFVNERAHATSIVSDLAKSIGEAYAIGRWVGGAITNFRKIWLMYHYKLKHKDDRQLTRFKFVLKSSLRGMNLLKSLPTLIFFNSVMHSYSATQEAHAMSIAAGGVTDTDALPDALLYPIPGNDDSFVSLYFLNKLIAKTVILGKIYAMYMTYKSFCENRATSIWYSVKKRLRRAKRRLRFLFRLRRREFGKVAEPHTSFQNKHSFRNLYKSNNSFSFKKRTDNWVRKNNNSRFEFGSKGRNDYAGFSKGGKKLSKLSDKRKISRFTKIKTRTRLVSKSYTDVVKNYRAFLSSRFSDIGKNKQSLKFYFRNIVKYAPEEFLKAYRTTLIRRKLMEGEICIASLWSLLSLYATRCLYLLEEPWALYERLSYILHDNTMTVWQYYFMLFPAVNLLNRILYILRRALIIHFFRRTISPLSSSYLEAYEELSEDCDFTLKEFRKSQVWNFSRKLNSWTKVLFRKHTFFNIFSELCENNSIPTLKGIHFIINANNLSRKLFRDMIVTQNLLKRTFDRHHSFKLSRPLYEQNWYTLTIEKLLRWPEGAHNLFYVLHARFFRRYVISKYLVFNFIIFFLKKKYRLNKLLSIFLRKRSRRYLKILRKLLIITKPVLRKLS